MDASPPWRRTFQEVDMRRVSFACAVLAGLAVGFVHSAAPLAQAGFDYHHRYNVEGAEGRRQRRVSFPH